MFQRIHGAQKFNLKQQKGFGVFLQQNGDMKDNYTIPDGLYTGVISRRIWKYWEELPDIRKQLENLEIFFLAGFQENNGNLAGTVCVNVEEEDYTDYRVGDCIVLEIENQKVKSWELWRDTEYYNEWFEYLQ